MFDENVVPYREVYPAATISLILLDRYKTVVN
jgi:hypothetical protein